MKLRESESSDVLQAMLASQLPGWAWTLVTDLGEAGQPIGHGQTVSGDGKQGLIKNTNLYREKL